MNPEIETLARRHGVALAFHQIDGRETVVSEATVLRVLEAIGVGCRTAEERAASLAASAGALPPRLEAPGGQSCFQPAWLRDRGAWGISLQLYELRSSRNWGIGDFADLEDICRIGGAAGADFVGLNPLHALFLAAPARCSPFSPSNRRFLNPLYIAVDRLPFHSAGRVDQRRLKALRAAPLVDYRAVCDLKIPALRHAFAEWRQAGGLPEAYGAAAFQRFREQGGEALRLHALFETLSLAMVSAGQGSGWRDWPDRYRDARSGEVAEFASAHASEVAFHTWLQWIAASQLQQAARAAEDAGMRIGLYLDFAVGEAPDGSATWSDPEDFLGGLSIGAPPDVFTADGQYWGLAALSPRAMRSKSLGNYLGAIEGSLRYGGALRIDHVMSLWQFFLVPEGGAPADGTYVRYPITDLLAGLASLSQQRKTIVIGEDLGNVPPGFREVMQAAAILSYRILYFEQHWGRFIAPRDYPEVALACLSTHDLPTLKAWWRGDDIALRVEHGLIGPEDGERQRSERSTQKAELMASLEREHLLPGDIGAEAPELSDVVMVAVHRFVARTRSLLAAVRLADLTGEIEPTNLPGTIDSFPNWRVRNSVPLEELAALPLLSAMTRAMAAERPR